jgi:hypothetical protein
MYSERWLVIDWHIKSSKTHYTGVLLIAFGGFSPHTVYWRINVQMTRTL